MIDVQDISDEVDNIARRLEDALTAADQDLLWRVRARMADLSRHLHNPERYGYKFGTFIE